MAGMISIKDAESSSYSCFCRYHLLYCQVHWPFRGLLIHGLWKISNVSNDMCGYKVYITCDIFYLALICYLVYLLLVSLSVRVNYQYDWIQCLPFIPYICFPCRHVTSHLNSSLVCPLNEKQIYVICMDIGKSGPMSVDVAFGVAFLYFAFLCFKYLSIIINTHKMRA
eukprot:jgi/Galph1/1825/GphlegSOOS_G520.1